ncbi:hypothetical protein Vretimale_3910 [Volvox reticuliferus]|uniref:Derlin n=1 Tax=Volvox reticuliferus TaxID=1737510 RepID=A0A8J4FHA2_9CHLO|nr:hypothetical protein Vretifemale_1514 [Volvox reticuliferus]GIL98542.1 hypothetical protein Vretimale_3910 [Volvox reticuliferus]
MPPRPVNANEIGHGPLNWYEGLPPITRAYGTVLFVTGLLQTFKMIRVFWLALLWSRIYSHFEVWRLVTNFFFCDKMSLRLVFRLIWLFTYGKTLESQTYQFEPADYLYMLLFGAVCILAAAGLSEWLFAASMLFVFNADGLIFMTLYVWSRNYPDQPLSIYNLFTIQSFYLPFFYVALEFLFTGAFPWVGLVGIAVGHLYYYLYDMYPAIGGPQLLVTPTFLKNLLADWGLGRRPNTRVAPVPAGFQAFHGRGRRLGAS